jgi:diguanylate cyclase (GGDEF)-like protein
VSLTVLFLMMNAGKFAAELKQAHEIQERLASIDDLTGAYNRRRFFELCDAEVRRARRYGHPMSVLLLDVDHFKSVNDSLGHAVGDVVLKSVTGKCRESIRQNDVLARIGGDEFAILLPETGIDAGERLADRIRTAVEASGSVTVSIGLAELGTRDIDADRLMGMADAALYGAKFNGRNRVVRADPAAGDTG